MEELLKQINDKLETLITNRKDDYDLLSPEDITRETGIPANNVREIFRNNKELAVQTYTKPHRVTRKAWNEFISERR
ncbi:MAG: hypothetical protein IKF38_05005 [Clostridia bacterium]|nr:hypothetical protein [Clostridia bacterium]